MVITIKFWMEFRKYRFISQELIKKTRARFGNPSGERFFGRFKIKKESLFIPLKILKSYQ